MEQPPQLRKGPVDFDIEPEVDISGGISQTFANREPSDAVKSFLQFQTHKAAAEIGKEKFKSLLGEIDKQEQRKNLIYTVGCIGLAFAFGYLIGCYRNKALPPTIIQEENSV